jgi:hypothetical protein
MIKREFSVLQQCLKSKNCEDNYEDADDKKADLTTDLYFLCPLDLACN